MPFPDSERVIYKKNPIIEVVCQLRFHQILRITSDSPATFQDRIRHIYPGFNKRPSTKITLPPNVLKEVPQETFNLLSAGQEEDTYDFISDDGNWTIALNKGFLALTTKQYTNWDDFKDHLREPLEALREEYTPAYFTRVGLRYINHIRKSDWDKENVGWTNLINPHLVGVIGSPDVGSEVSEVLCQSVVNLDEQVGKVTIRHGLVHRVEDDIIEEETGFLIDNDFFTKERTEPEDVFTTLERFHLYSGKVFNWCITDEFRRAMGSI